MSAAAAMPMAVAGGGGAAAGAAAPVEEKTEFTAVLTEPRFLSFFANGLKPKAGYLISIALKTLPLSQAHA